MTVAQARFEEVVRDVSGGNPKLPQSEFLTVGRLPVVDQGKRFVAGYTDDETYQFRSEQLPVVVFGDHTKAVKFVDFPFVMGADGVKVLKPKDGCDAKFLYHFLRHAKLPDAGYSRHFKFLKELKVPLPTLVEQRRIATILDKADALRAKRHEAIAKLDQLLQCVFIDMFGDLKTNPRGWSKELLGKLVVVDAPLVDPIDPQFENLLHYGPDRIERDSGRLMDAKSAKEDGLISKKFLCDTRHVLYSKIRPHLNKVALVDKECLCSADVYPIEPKRLAKRFLWHVLRSDSFLEHAATFSNRANIPKINRAQLLQYECVVPPPELQEQFDRVSEQFDRLIAMSSFAARRMEECFIGLQHRAFLGAL